MNRTNWSVGIICLSLLLIGGFALDVSAQQPPAAPTPAETPQAPERSPAPPPPPRTEYGGQPQQAPPTSSQIETSPEAPTAGEPGSFLGVDPTIAMVIGAVLVIVVVIGLVAISRRGDQVRDTHRRHQV
jgi:hypothetical protein